jgi:L-seryl-tRNA(Ser) seleniumtransferase
MTDRRAFLKGMSALPASAVLPLREAESRSMAGRDYYREIGVKPFINAAAAYSSLGGRNMWPAVVEAMEYARKRNVIMEELHDAVGSRIASLIGCEAAMVTSGATGAMTVGTAACLTGKDEERIRRIPDLRGMKNEVIIQKSHRFAYDHGVRNCGIRFIEVETIEDVERAVNDKTAMLFFCYLYDEHGKIKLREFAALGKKHGIPTLIDGSNTVPPLERLSGYLNSGFDLAAFSGGKGLRGPYSAGLLLGRKDLIEAARLNSSPYSDTIGRGMKVSKEEILGMMVAVEYSLQFDYSVEMKRESRLVELISNKVSSIPGIGTEVVYPLTEGGRPHLRLYWNQSDIGLSVEEVQQRLEEGEPSIRTCYLGLSDGEFEIGTAMLKEEEIDTLVSRVREVLSS